MRIGRLICFKPDKLLKNMDLEGRGAVEHVAFDDREALIQLTRQLSSFLKETEARIYALAGYLEPPAHVDYVRCSLFETYKQLQVVNQSASIYLGRISSSVTSRRMVEVGSAMLPDKDVRVFANQLLGSGGFGSVFKGEYRHWKVALKFVNDGIAEENLEKEARMLTLLQHPNVVHLHGVVRLAGRQYLVLDRLEGDLYSFCCKKGIWKCPPAHELTRIARDVMSGLHYLHTRNPPVCHLDLKPKNILYRIIGGRVEISLTDFGLAHLGDGGPDCGTNIFKAPEVLHRKAEAASDIYSFAVTFFVLIFSPYYGYDGSIAMAEEVRKKTLFPQLPVGAESYDLLYSILRECWVSNVSQRGSSGVMLRKLEEALIRDYIACPVLSDWWLHSFNVVTSVDFAAFFPDLLNLTAPLVFDEKHIFEYRHALIHTICECGFVQLDRFGVLTRLLMRGVRGAIPNEAFKVGLVAFFNTVVRLVYDHCFSPNKYRSKEDVASFLGQDTKRYVLRMSTTKEDALVLSRVSLGAASVNLISDRIVFDPSDGKYHVRDANLYGTIATNLLETAVSDLINWYISHRSIALISETFVEPGRIEDMYYYRRLGPLPPVTAAAAAAAALLSPST